MVILCVCLGAVQYWWISIGLVVVQLRAVFCRSSVRHFPERSWTVVSFPCFTVVKSFTSSYALLQLLGIRLFSKVHWTTSKLFRKFWDNCETSFTLLCRPTGIYSYYWTENKRYSHCHTNSDGFAENVFAQWFVPSSTGVPPGNQTLLRTKRHSCRPTTY